MVANARELQVAREAVCEAWKRDIRAGALAGLARGRGGEGAGGA